MSTMLSSNDLILQVRKMEKALSKHPYIVDAVVVSLSTPTGEQRIKAFIEPGNPPPSVESIMEYCQDDWIKPQLPIDLIFKNIPRTPSGKVIRRQLLES